jgi:hypothetical protein
MDNTTAANSSDDRQEIGFSPAPDSVAHELLTLARDIDRVERQTSATVELGTDELSFELEYDLGPGEQIDQSVIDVLTSTVETAVDDYDYTRPDLSADEDKSGADDDETDPTGLTRWRELHVSDEQQKTIEGIVQARESAVRSYRDGSDEALGFLGGLAQAKIGGELGASQSDDRSRSPASRDPHSDEPSASKSAEASKGSDRLENHVVRDAILDAIEDIYDEFNRDEAAGGSWRDRGPASLAPGGQSDSDSQDTDSTETVSIDGDDWPASVRIYNGDDFFKNGDDVDTLVAYTDDVTRAPAHAWSVTDHAGVDQPTYDGVAWAYSRGMIPEHLRAGLDE